MLTVSSGNPTVTELEVKRSRFITCLARAETVGRAREVVAECRSTYPDARHHCSAFIVTPEGLNPQQHSSDDGEPSGTAGLPMLQVLAGFDLENVVAVVTRYFGGVLLGTGGLVRAYSQAVTQAVQEVPLVQVVTLPLVRAEVPALFAGRVEAELRRANWELVEVSWAETVRFEIAADSEKHAALRELFATVVKQPVEVEVIGTIRHELPYTLD